MFKNARNLARKFGSKAAAGAAVIGMTAMQAAHAAGFDDGIDAVDLSGLAVKVGAAALLIIGVAIAFKGSDLGKRIVRKV